jgi:cellulose synthase/poly-beta-1,6-N-acetylglucosamine synthase-like glycosyltransferase
MIKNLVRQNAVQRLSGFALLQGTGMAFPRAVFDRVEWRGGSLVEDLDMGIDLVLAGIPVVFDPAAEFFSDASSEAGTASQRRRWEHGMLHSMGRNVPALFRKALAGNWRLIFAGLDLMIPPTVMLVAVASAVLALGLIVLGPSVPVWVLLSALGLLGIGLLRAWLAHGREILPLRNLAEIPAYIGWKLPIALQFFTQRESNWTRTERGP